MSAMKKTPKNNKNLETISLKETNQEVNIREC